jgi:tRNA(Arg) A34 adenosine deaminase TadA
MSATPADPRLVEGLDDAARLIGARVDTVGGEPGVLALLVDWAARHGSTGALPFTAIVVRHGIVIGAGANSALADFDPTSHGEIVAIRDATRRAASADLGGTIVFSSCEPCAICRTVSAAAGVLEIVFAAGRESVPTAMDPAPETTHQLMDAVSEILPRIARRGVTGLSAAELAAPFRAYLDAVGT